MALLAGREPDEAVTQLGDLWILGNHRLLCGDSSNPDHLDRQSWPNPDSD